MSHRKPTIVLVHGEWTDASLWRLVIPLLERAGFPVVAVQLPLTSFAEDVAATRRAFATQPAGVVAAGHSYGGAVITNAAAGNPQVGALVYVAGYAPDQGENIEELTKRFGLPPAAVATVAGVAQFLFLDRRRYHELFASDLNGREAAVMAATQKPIAAAALLARTVQPAWREIPSWYLVAANDQVVSPKLQRYMAARLGAVRIAEVSSSHVPQLSRPSLIADFIREAAGTCK